MRHLIAAILLLATASAAQAQCPLGAFPTTNGDGRIVCQSAGGQRPLDTQTSSRNVTCPEGATASIDNWGNRTCSTLAERPEQPLSAAPAPSNKPARSKFEISKKCPQCK
jgi:hypothetical protein